MNILQIFKALSDDTRLRLFNLLCKHELNVNEIVAIMKMGQSRISRHLKILSDGGLLTHRRDGLWTFYTASLKTDQQELLDSLYRSLQKDRFYCDDMSELELALQELQNQKSKYFDSIAQTLEEVKYDIIGDDVISKTIVSIMRNCDVVADLGCGTGDLVPFIKQKCSFFIGIDRSMKMLDLARERFQNESSTVDFRIGEIEYLPMKNNEAGCAVINMVLHYLPSPSQGIRECGRILKPGSQLIIVDFEKHTDEELRTTYGHRWLGFKHNEIKKWLDEENFEIENIKTIKAKNNLKILFISAKYKG